MYDIYLTFSRLTVLVALPIVLDTNEGWKGSTTARTEIEAITDL